MLLRKLGTGGSRMSLGGSPRQTPGGSSSRSSISRRPRRRSGGSWSCSRRTSAPRSAKRSPARSAASSRSGCLSAPAAAGGSATADSRASAASGVAKSGGAFGPINPIFPRDGQSLRPRVGTRPGACAKARRILADRPVRVRAHSLSTTRAPVCTCHGFPPRRVPLGRQRRRDLAQRPPTGPQRPRLLADLPLAPWR